MLHGLCADKDLGRYYLSRNKQKGQLVVILQFRHILRKPRHHQADGQILLEQNLINRNKIPKFIRSLDLINDRKHGNFLLGKFFKDFLQNNLIIYLPFIFFAVFNLNPEHRKRNSVQRIQSFLNRLWSLVVNSLHIWQKNVSRRRNIQDDKIFLIFNFLAKSRHKRSFAASTLTINQTRLIRTVRIFDFLKQFHNLTAVVNINRRKFSKTRIKRIVHNFLLPKIL